MSILQIQRTDQASLPFAAFPNTVLTYLLRQRGLIYSIHSALSLSYSMMDKCAGLTFSKLKKPEMVQKLEQYDAVEVSRKFQALQEDLMQHLNNQLDDMGTKGSRTVVTISLFTRTDEESTQKVPRHYACRIFELMLVITAAWG